MHALYHHLLAAHVDGIRRRRAREWRPALRFAFWSIVLLAVGVMFAPGCGG